MCAVESKNCMARSVFHFRPFVFVKINPRILPARSRMPKERSGHRIVCDDKNLYSFGGYNPFINDDPEVENDPAWRQHGPLFKELWRYNFATKTWFRVFSNGNLPNALASSAVALKGATMMIYGGTAFPFGMKPSNKLTICNLRDDYKMHAVKVEGSLPPKQYGQAIVVDGPFLYTIGGTTGFDYTADVHRLDLRSGVWEEVYLCTGRAWREPQARYRHELAFDGTRIYLLGGGTAEEVYGFQELPAFNVITGAWENLTTQCDPNAPSPGVPAARRCHGCVQIPNEGTPNATVFICGGYNGDEMFSDTWKLDLHTLQWTLMVSCRLPKAVYFHSVAVTPAGCMYSFGGITESENNVKRTSDIHSAWLCIPRLSEMCWEAIMYYNPDLPSLPKDKLLDCGLPLEYINRIEG